MGWCDECYADGEAVLSAEPDGTVCGFHSRLSATLVAGATPPATRASPGPTAAGEGQLRRPSSRPGPAGPSGTYRGGRPARRSRREQDRSAARLEEARAYGRARACARVNAGRWQPHPGWCNRLPAGVRVVTDQSEALQLLRATIDALPWRGDRRRRALCIAEQLVYAMSWDTNPDTAGVIAGRTLTHLLTAAGCSSRTVTNRLRDLQDAGVLFVVERGAQASFLGSRHNRAQSYVVLAPRTDHASPNVGRPSPDDQQQDQTCHLPGSSGKELKPLNNPLGLDKPPPPHWPAWRIPQTPSERRLASLALLTRIGLDRPRLTSKAPAMLYRWWQAGWCIAGLLYAIDHHPDHPKQSRGNATRKARNPLGTIGTRLAPWDNRLGDVPANLQGHRGDYVAEQAQRLTQRIAAADQARRAAPPSTPDSPQRAAAKELIAATLTRRRAPWNYASEESL